MENYLNRITNELKTLNCKIDIIYSSDYHDSENPDNQFNYRKKLFGFSSSAGIVYFVEGKPYIRLDSRYHLAAEIFFKDSDVVVIKDGENEVLDELDWFKTILTKGDKISINKSSVNRKLYLNYEIFANKNQIEIIDSSDIFNKTNIEKVNIDSIATECSYDLNYYYLKLKEKFNETNFLITSLDTVALFTRYRNLHAKFGDTFFYSFLFLSEDKFILFSNLQNFLIDENIELRSYSDFFDFIGNLKNKTVVCEDMINQKIFETLVKNNNLMVIDYDKYIPTLKSIKGEKEIANIKKSMVEDFYALNKFHNFIKKTNFNLEKFDENMLVDILKKYRLESKSFLTDSFSTIMGFNENGAIVHYNSEESNMVKTISDGMLLVDSGAQYKYGTTDVTRTFIIGKPNKEQIFYYTVVLKAHIALASLKFKKTTKSSELDSCCRKVMQEYNLFYGHGTGHGVGYLNCVHESPFTISPLSSICLEKNIILSCEPGYYIKDKYGIRLENLLLCKEAADKDFLEFEVLTLAYFDEDLIDYNMLTSEEIGWLKNYKNKMDLLVK